MRPEDRDASLLDAHLWKGGELPFMELCSLWRSGRGHRLQGHVTGLLKDVSFAMRYRIECDEVWRTRAVWIELDAPPHVRELRIEVNAARQWIVNGAHRRELDGLIDVDIQASPSTNTLPIRRLHMEAGRSYAVNAAWIQVPSLDIAPIPQEYTRLDARRLRFRSGDFNAELEVDEHGVVERYGKFWHRIDPH